MQLDLVLQLTVDVRNEEALQRAARQSLAVTGDDAFARAATSTTPGALSVLLGNGLVLDALQAVVQDAAGLDLTGVFVDPSTVVPTPASRPR